MSPNSTLQNFTIVCPSSSGAAGILYDHELPYTCGVRFLKLIGSASTTEGYPSGSGIGPDGIRIKGGKIIGLEIRVGPGKFNSILDVSEGGGPNAISNSCSDPIISNTSSAGVLAAQAIHIPPQPKNNDRPHIIINGAKCNGISTENASTSGYKGKAGTRLQLLDFNCGTQNVENGFNCGTGTSVLLSNNLFDLTNGLYITTDDAQVDCLGGKIDVRQTDGGINTNTGFNIKVDDNLTGIASGPNPNSVVKVTSQTEPIFSIPCEWINSDHAFDFFTQKNTFEKNTTKQLWGADQVIGHPEKGSSFFSGEGIPYSSDITVFSVSNQIGLYQPPNRYIWDNVGPTIKSSLETFCNNISQKPPPSASANLNITDITESAGQDDSNNFTFNSASAGEILMWCSNRKNESCEFLKHWSINLTSVSNAVIDGYLVNNPRDRI